MSELAIPSLRLWYILVERSSSSLSWPFRSPFIRWAFYHNCSAEQLDESLVHRSDAESIIQLLGAVGVLVIPASFGAWIFSTIRALHLRQLRFWQMRSTYVSLIFGVLALGLVLLNAAILLFSKDHSSFQADTTLYLAGRSCCRDSDALVRMV